MGLPLMVLLWLVGDSANWRPPFLFIGALGLFWAVGWFWLVRCRDVDPVAAVEQTEAAPTSTWLTVVTDRRFWILVAVVICINSTWHFFRLHVTPCLQTWRRH